MTFGSALAATVGMTPSLPAGADALAPELALAAALAVPLAGGATVVAGGGAVAAACAVVAACTGSLLGRNIANEIPVARSAATAMVTTATMPRRDRGGGGDASSAVEPSVAYDCALAGGSDTRAVSLATASPGDLATGTSGTVISLGGTSDPVDIGGGTAAAAPPAVWMLEDVRSLVG